MDKPSPSTNTPKPNKTALKSQLIVLSPDVLKKLGIASQISKLTKAAASQSSTVPVASSTKTTTTSTTTTTKTTTTTDQSILLENEIKQRLSQTIKINKSVKEKSVKNLITTSDNKLEISNSSEINVNSKTSNQLNPNESNLLLNSNKLNENDAIKISVTNKISETVLNDTSIRKSGRKRKISTILENYVTELNDAEGKTVEKHVKITENKQKLSKTHFKDEKCVDSVKTPTPDDCNADGSNKECKEKRQNEKIIDQTIKDTDNDNKINTNEIISTKHSKIIENKHKTKCENLSVVEMPESEKNNQIEFEEKTDKTKEEDATVNCSANQSDITTIKSIDNEVAINQCIEKEEMMNFNDKSSENLSISTIIEEISNNIDPKELKEDTSKDSTKISIESELESRENLTSATEIDKIDSEKNLKSVNIVNLKVEELLRPQKRGRPKGRKIHSTSGPIFVEKSAIIEAVQLKTEDSPSLRRRSGRQRKEKKLEDVVYYDSPGSSTRSKVEVVKNEDLQKQKEDTPDDGIKKRGRPRRKQVEEVVEEVVTPRRVGRPPRNKSLNNNENEEEEPVIKFERKKKINIIESDTEDDDDDDEVVLSERSKNKTEQVVVVLGDDLKSDDHEETKKNPRGKKRGRNSNVTKVQMMKIVECGVCNEKIANRLWSHHCSKHNYLCWRVGEDPIDLKNRKLCEGILVKVAMTKKVTFTCSKCGEKRKSAVGYLSHMDVCQKSEEERLAMRVMCPECKKLMQPCSLKIHMRNHMHESSKITASHPISEDSNMMEDGPRTKRNAAKKAQGLINKFTNDNDTEYEPFEKEIKRLYKSGSDSRKIFSQRKYIRLFDEKFKGNGGTMGCPMNECPYVGSNLKEMKEHIETCSRSKLNSDEYICCVCLFITQDEQQIEKHVLDNHLMDSVDQEFSCDGDGSQLDLDLDEDIPSIDEQIDIDEDLLLRRRKKVARPNANTTSNGEHSSRSCIDKINFLSNEVRVSASRNCTYPAAGKWSIQFCERNYSLKNLFKGFQVSAENWRPIPSLEHEKYLPPTRRSIGVKTVLASKKLPDLQGKQHEWKEFGLFETELSHDTWTIFCGGPVWELAWLPTPINSIVDQILAVSIQRNFNDTFKTSQSYKSSEMIQFWNFGKLHFKNPLTNQAKAKLEFCLIHNHGNVWCMEWCPSGCYDDSQADSSQSDCLRRMGLLALACSDGNIPIYSICFPQINNNDDDGELKMFKPTESCRLIMQDDEEIKLGNWNYQCTKLNWSKFKGHNKIAAGYSNGMVCLWDLDMCKNECPLLKSVDDNGTILLKPYFSFQPHTAAITALHFYYPLTDDTVRWLFTGSWDRNCYVWDLQEVSTPVFMFTKRGNVSDGTMINHWLCSFISFDDVHFLEHTTTSIQNIRDFGFKNSSLLSANSMVMGLSASDWANAVAQVTLAGELCCTFQRQLLLGYDVDKGSRCKRFLISYCEPIDKHLNPTERKEKLQIKNKEKQAAANANIPEKYDKHFFRYLVSKENDQYAFAYEDEPDTYEQVCNKYGIIFCDIPLDDYDKIPPETLKMVRTSCNMKDAPTEMYPILSQNRVRWNPNKQAYVYLCSGYHSGFVRLRCVRFMHSKILTHIK